MSQNTPYRHTKIIFTIGPATESEGVLEQLLRNGVDVCRLNMAHADHPWTRRIIRRVREVSRRVGRHVAIMMDVKGPEIRTGDVPETFHLQADELFDFYVLEGAREEVGDGVRGTSVNYPGLLADVKVGDTVLVDSGLIRMEVVGKSARRLRCRTIIPGPIGNRRHINLPGVHINLPAITEKDGADIAVGIAEGVDFFALSFVREADDLDILRRFLSERQSEARIIAKIEDQTAVANLDEIIAAADGLMVARGDLGIEIPFEQLPRLQRRAVNACLGAGKVVIVATHMLESMIQSPLPTRAEITDVANAVLEQADCVMLSGETTVGKYPVECINVMNRIIRETERLDGQAFNPAFRPRTPKGKMLRSAAILAADVEDAAIVVFTRSGLLARTLSAMRPRRCPIYAFTDIDQVFFQLLILWGIEPFRMDFSDDMEATVGEAISTLRGKGWVNPGQPLVFITNVLAGQRVIDTIQLRWVD